MSNRVIDAFFETTNGKLSPEDQAKIEHFKIHQSQFQVTIDHQLDHQERYERGNQVLRETAEALVMLNLIEATLSDPAPASRAAKLVAINEMSEILNAPLDAETDTDMTVRAMNLEAIRKRISGQAEAGRAANLEAIG
jgi:hypothetical protein